MDKENRRPTHGHGPGVRMTGEKAKDFKGSMKKLINYCKPLMPLIIISIILAFLSSILSII